MRLGGLARFLDIFTGMGVYQWGYGDRVDDERNVVLRICQRQNKGEAMIQGEIHLAEA